MADSAAAVFQRPRASSSLSHWTPNVNLGSEVNGEVKEQEVNVIEQPRSRKKLESQGSEGEEGQLYTVATKKAIRSLMQEYKKRKQQPLSLHLCQETNLQGAEVHSKQKRGGLADAGGAPAQEADPE